MFHKRFFLQKKAALIYLCAFTLLTAMLFAFTYVGISDFIPEYVALVVLFVGTVFVIAYLNSQVSDKQAQFWVLSGYYLRLLLMLVNIMLQGKIAVPPMAGADDDSFWYKATMFYEDIIPTYYEKYSLYMSKAMRVFGSNRVVAQYINIMAWFITAIIILYIAKRLLLRSADYRFVSFVIAFMPINICLTSILLRESLMILFDTLSFIFFLYWMKNGKLNILFAAFLSTVPAILLHNSSVALWVGYVITLLFWNPKRQRFQFHCTNMGKLMLIVVLLGIIWYVPALNHALLGKFSVHSNLTLYGITHRPVDAVGGSAYLTDMDCKNGIQFIVYTVIRMFYFLFSPLPMDWRNLSDIVAFGMDSIPFLVLIILCLTPTKKIYRPYVFVGLLSIAMMVGIFAWGTMTVGTAMRHRGQLIGIFLLTYCYAHAGKTEKILLGNEVRDES